MARYVAPRPQEYDSSGSPLSGGLLYFYTAGTTNAKNTYQDSDLETAHANPVVADSAGRWATIFLDGSYKVVLKDSAGTTIWTEDNYSAGASGDFFGTVSSITSTTAIDSTYNKFHLDCTQSSGINLNLDAAATLGAGFVVSLVNNGTGDVTIDGNASETINGTTTITVSPDSGGILVCDGSNWSFIGVNDAILDLKANLTTNTFDGAQIGTVEALTSTSNSIAVDLSLNNNFSHTLTENTTLANPTNATAGQSGQIAFTQHASSAKTLAFAANWTSIDGATPTISTTTDAKNILSYYVQDSSTIWFSFQTGGVS